MTGGKGKREEKLYQRLSRKSGAFTSKWKVSKKTAEPNALQAAIPREVHRSSVPRDTQAVVSLREKKPKKKRLAGNLAARA